MFPGENGAAFSDSDNCSSVCFPEGIDPSLPDLEALRRLSNNLGSLFQSPEFGFCSDASITVGPIEVGVHRCVLSARSQFFLNFFSRKAVLAAEPIRIELKELLGGVDVGLEALSFVLEYLYSGRVAALPQGVCMCADDDCSHVGCRAAVDFAVEVLYASFIFQIFELVNLFQRHLIDVLEMVAVDDIPVILCAANFCSGQCGRLLTKCSEIVINSDLDSVILEKALPLEVFNQIMGDRIAQGLQAPESFPFDQARRIHKALDSDDIELVKMLLKEGNSSLDNAYALHYAVAHCDPKTVAELLRLGLTDVHLRNSRGYTPLHVAAMRREPQVIVSLLTKGARPFDRCLDGWTAVQIAKRRTKHADYYMGTEEGKASPKERLCVEILEQAERKDPLVGEASVSTATASDELRQRLLDLENRVALARLLFPMEAKVAMDIAQVDGTLEFSLGTTASPIARLNLNETPFKVNEEHIYRVKALSKTVQLGKYFFPRCSQVLDKIMDDDIAELSFAGKNGPGERSKRVAEELDALAKAFEEDKLEFQRSSLSSTSKVQRRRLCSIK
ncbi:hypothetical protein HPP92_003978 [Vanilla planifolia]|uniref:Uncharacterized protein n=1 Tax=Vanilla planifolia TaxID=51239 RepID=A0A835S869_VANPL|nr:hypothetical protein HPP92_003978 [Vanilla planifolia]